MLDHANGQPLVGKEFKLDWSDAPNGHPAQVEWIEISYQELPAASGEDSVGSLQTRGRQRHGITVPLTASQDSGITLPNTAG